MGEHNQHAKEAIDLLQIYHPMLWKALILYGVVLLAIVVDLWSGIRKSKAKGEYTHSYGLRKTVDKTARYLNILLMATLIDVILTICEIHAIPAVPFIPIATALFAFILCGIEMYSVFEKDENKGRYIEGAKVFAEILKMSSAKDLSKLIEMIEEKKEQGKQKEKDGKDEEHEID